MKVLVLDDHQAFRDEVVEMMGRRGHEARGVGRADDAIPLAESGEYDFVLVDFSMPEHDGIWFMKHVKLPPNTKALLVTAHVNKDMMAQMFKLGAAGYLIKPFDEGDLVRHLQFHWRGSAARAGCSGEPTRGEGGRAGS
jgi:two-component system, cell cycle response regulator CpdR